MTTMINTADDLVRAVRENEEFRAAMRRELLTEELLELPRRFEEYREANDRRLDTLIESVNTLTQHSQSTDKRFDTLIQLQTDMRGDIRALHEMYRRQHEDFGRFRGNYAEAAMLKNGGTIAWMIGRQRGLRRTFYRPFGVEELGGLLGDNYDAVDALHLRDRAWRTFQNPDLVAEVTELRKRDEPLYYIAVEASYTGGIEDTQRATDHARILRSATGLDAYAIVAAVREGPDIEGSVFHSITEFVASDDEDAVFLYQLTEEELEP